MCPRCARKHPVGWRCKECAKELRSPLYVVSAERYVLAGLAGLAVSAVAAGIMAQIGGFWFIGIFAGMGAGGVIGEVVSVAAGRKRGRGLQWVAAGSMVAGALLIALLAGVILHLPPLRALFYAFNLGVIIYLVLGIGAATTRLR